MSCEIIGITRTDCKCYSADTFENKSGIYLSELEGFSLLRLKDSETCEKGTYLEHIKTAIENAEYRLKNDLMATLISGNYYEENTKINGQIGQNKTSNINPISTNKDKLVYRIICNNLKNTKVKITSLGLFFENATPINCKVYDSFGVVIKDITLTPSVSRYKIQLTDIELDCDVEGVQYPEYFIVVDISQNKPFQLKHVCCGDNYYFNYTSPYFLDIKARGWRSVINVGYSLDDNFDIDKLLRDEIICRNFAGLVLNVETICNADNLICSDKIDYKNDDYGIGLALALRYKTASIIFTDILTRVSPDNVNADAMMALLKMWDNYYLEHLNNIQRMDLRKYQSCFRPKKRFETNYRRF